MTNCIDISSHQGKIDWKKVKAAGYHQAIIRAGWSWFEGGMDPDVRFLENISGAIAAGIDVGAYLYSYDLTPASARIGATRLLEAIRPYRLRMPVVFDLESDQSRVGKLGRELTPREASEIALAALETIEQGGYYAMLYSYTYWLQSYLTDERLKRYDKWVADVRSGLDKPGYSGAYGIWQYSWKGRVDGISADVDLNKVYRDYPTLIEKAGLNHLGANSTGGCVGSGSAQEMELLKTQYAELERKLAAELEGRQQAEEKLASLGNALTQLHQSHFKG